MIKKNVDGKDQNLVFKGLQKVAQTLRNTQTTIKKEGISVTLTAEPKIINLQVDRNVSDLSEKIKNCLNEAFLENSRKILEQATKELDSEPS